MTNTTILNLEIWNEITCTFGSFEHLLEDPIYLTCKKAACLQCLLAFVDKQMVIHNCKYCSHRHDLASNISIDVLLKDKISNLLRENKHELLSFAKTKLQDKFNRTVKETNKRLDCKKIKLEEELDKRINILKDHNDSLFEENIVTIQNSKKIIMNEIDRISDSNVVALEKLLQLCNTKNGQIQTGNNETLNQNVSEIESCLKVLSCLTRKSTFQINQIHFDETNVLTKNLIGSFKQTNTEHLVSQKIENEVVDYLSLFDDANSTSKTLSRIEYIQDWTSNNQIKLNTRYITCDKDKNLLILNLNDNYLYKLNLYGKMIKKYDLGLQDVTLDPRGICLNDNGELFVTNISNNKIIKYTSFTYQYMLQFGDDLSSPRGIECYQEKLYVCDYNNKRIRVFNNQSLVHLSDIYINDNQNFFPFNVKVKHDQIIVTDLSNAICIFNVNNLAHLNSIRDNNRIYQPRGLLVDQKQNICFCAISENNIYKLYFYGLNGLFRNEFNLTTESVFDILIINHKYNEDVYFYASIGERGLIYYEIKK